MIYANARVAAIVAASVFLCHFDLAAAGSTHHHHRLNNDNPTIQRKLCKDRPGAQCNIIVDDGDCEKPTARGESYGDSVCQVSCGRCEEVSNEIFTDHLCYPFAKQAINVQFSNRIPIQEDWVGIYPESADPNDLGSPVAWYWLCGDKKHKCRTSVGSVNFPWLPPGVYKAIMSRNKAGAPGPYPVYGSYASYAESQPFEVARGDGCVSRRLNVDTNGEISAQSSLRGTQL